MQINIKLFYKLIPLILVDMARPVQLPKITNLQNLCNVSFLQMSIAVIYKLILSFYIISRKNWGRNFIFCMMINMKIFYKLMVLFLMSLARQAQITKVKFAISLWYLKKEVRNEFRDLTAPAGWNITLTTCNMSNILPPLTLFLWHYGIHTSLFFISLIVCVETPTKVFCCQFCKIFKNNYFKELKSRCNNNSK